MSTKRASEEVHTSNSTIDSIKKHKVDPAEHGKDSEDNIGEKETVSEPAEDAEGNESVKVNDAADSVVEELKNSSSEAGKAEETETAAAKEIAEKAESNDQAIDPVFGEPSSKDEIIADSTLKLAETPIKVASTDPTMINKIKKLNHKEVERRRRETINNAIRELQELVPTTHTNKAQIIRKASEFIKKLKEKEENLVNKWTLEKIITDQAISELANSNEKLKTELEKAYREIEHRKQVFESFTALVSKQENSEEISNFLSRVSDLFEEDAHIDEHEEDFAKSNRKEAEQRERDDAEDSKENVSNREEPGTKEQESATTEG